MDESKIQKAPQKPEEQEIDLIELAQKVWAERKMLYKVCGIAAVIGLIVGFSIPKEYSTEVTLAPESASKVNAGSMGALAAMAGINLGGSVGEDALSPELYPDIVKSTPFLLELFDVRVKDQKGKIDTTLYAYLDKYQRSSWMGAVMSAPFKALGWTLSLFKDKPEKKEGKIDPFHLTLDEAKVADALSKRILVTIDKKTGVTTLEVYTQVSGQLQMARAKVQEITPVYTVVQPATVPLRAAKPNKIMILIGFVFLAGVGCVGWILFVKDLFKDWRKANKAI